MSRRVLVIGAHSADFVWRAGGAVATAVRAGGSAKAAVGGTRPCASAKVVTVAAASVSIAASATRA